MGIKRAIKQSSDEVINALINQMLIDKLISGAKFKDLLEESLRDSKSKAESSLSPVLFNSLDWPTNLTSYEQYLNDFSKWIPRQSTDPAWKNSKTNEMKEAFDRLCHFYWLVDQPVGEDRIKLRSIAWFSEWLIEYTSLWGSFLDTTESFTEDIFHSILLNSPKYRVQDSMIEFKDSEGEKWKKPNNPSGWLTFNQFFSRKLNPGLRPIANPCDNNMIISPADYTHEAHYTIAEDSGFENLEKKRAQITLKKTHNYKSAKNLLEGSMYKNTFANGTGMHYSLSPYSYHRFHAPVSGVVKELYSTASIVLLDVNISRGHFVTTSNAKDGYTFKQVRGVITIDTSDSPFGDVGIVAVVAVGMAQVSSVNMLATVGKETIKGDELGYFLFGGSDVIVLFQQHVKVHFIEYKSSKDRCYGKAIAKCN